MNYLTYSKINVIGDRFLVLQKTATVLHYMVAGRHVSGARFTAFSPFSFGALQSVTPTLQSTPVFIPLVTSNCITNNIYGAWILRKKRDKTTKFININLKTELEERKTMRQKLEKSAEKTERKLTVGRLKMLLTKEGKLL